jgi:XTP/dITP diphosphohydrolase
VTRLVLLATSPRVAPGLLSRAAWQVLEAGPVFVSDPGAAVAEALASAGIALTTIDTTRSSSALAADLAAAAASTGTATWVLRDEDDEVAAAVQTHLADAAPDMQIERLDGSWDLPGARLLDVVTVMDRLRSPGGCPWDARQDHATLAPYLLEEAYEAFQAIEDSDLDALRDELGDVLLQVAFHARMAEELPAAQRWTIDDVATGLVGKLVRRHPHVFAGTDVDGAEAVVANWEAIKSAERGGASAVAGVPMAAPALSLAATLQRKSARAGLDGLASTTPEARLVEYERSPSPEAAGELLWALVAELAGQGIDAEAALRARARAFRDRIAAAGTTSPASES